MVGPSNNGPAFAAPMGAENDRFLHQHRSQGQFSAGSRRLVLRDFVDLGLCFQRRSAAMCSGDAFRLCSSEIPNIPKITACMIKQRASLSSGCRAVLDRDLAAQSRKVAAQ